MRRASNVSKGFADTELSQKVDNRKDAHSSQNRSEEGLILVKDNVNWCTDRKMNQSSVFIMKYLVVTGGRQSCFSVRCVHSSGYPWKRERQLGRLVVMTEIGDLMKEYIAIAFITHGLVN